MRPVLCSCMFPALCCRDIVPCMCPAPCCHDNPDPPWQAGKMRHLSNSPDLDAAPLRSYAPSVSCLAPLTLRRTQASSVTTTLIARLTRPSVCCTQGTSDTAHRDSQTGRPATASVITQQLRTSMAGLPMTANLPHGEPQAVPTFVTDSGQYSPASATTWQQVCCIGMADQFACVDSGDSIPPAASLCTP
jgi:hypothetical protein